MLETFKGFKGMKKLPPGTIWTVGERRKFVSAARLFMQMQLLLLFLVLLDYVTHPLVVWVLCHARVQWSLQQRFGALLWLHWCVKTFSFHCYVLCLYCCELNLIIFFFKTGLWGAREGNGDKVRNIGAVGLVFLSFLQWVRDASWHKIGEGGMLDGAMMM